MFQNYDYGLIESTRKVPRSKSSPVGNVMSHAGAHAGSDCLFMHYNHEKGIFNVIKTI